MLNAFFRVAPKVLFNFLAIFAVAVFFFAKAFNSRTSVVDQARRFFDFLAISHTPTRLIKLGHAEGCVKALFAQRAPFVN